MKRCPSCNRVYTDESLSFCLDDGGKLVADAPPAQDPQATLMITPATLQTMQEQARQTDDNLRAQQQSVAPQQSYPPQQSSPPQYGSGARSQYTQPNQSWNPTPSSSPAPAKRGALPWVIGGLIVLVLGAVGVVVLVIVIAAVNSNSNNNNNKIVVNHGGGNDKTPTPTPTPESSSTVIESKDGVSEITVPAGWSEVTELNNNATIQASNPAQNLYAIVITDKRANLSSSTTLASYAETTSHKLSDTLTNMTQSGPESITVDGNPGLLYEFHGEIKNIKAAYLFAVVQTSGHLHQIGTWTLESDFVEKQSIMRGIIDSLHER
jgi:hypothetical protein